MSEWEAFESILAALHEAALDPDGWPGAAGSIDQLLGTHGSTLACGDGESNENTRLYFLWTCLRGLNDEWAVQRARYLTLESITPVSDNTTVKLPTVDSKKADDLGAPLRRRGSRNGSISARAVLRPARSYTVIW